jgi:hypothetical protein
MTIEQSSPGTHGLFQVKVSFQMVVELEAENLPPLGADFGVAIFSWI